MASTTKSSTKWGSFFEKAVAGVESRLDTILGDEDETPRAEKSGGVPAPADKHDSTYTMEATKPAGQSSGTATLQAKSQLDYAPQSGGYKRPDRLQERLAKAVGGRNSPLSGSGTPSLASTSPRTSLDKENVRDSFHAQDGASTGNLTGTNPALDLLTADESRSVTRSSSVAPSAKMDAAIVQPQGSGESQLASNAASTPRRSLESNHSDFQRQDEVNSYLEQIESLRAKLQFLTQQASAEAKERASSADKGSLQQQLAEKDEKIALLLEEGSKLSQNELRLMTTIKSLRAKSSEDQKQITKARQAEEQSDKAIRSLQDKLKTAGTTSKDDSKQKVVLDNLRKDLEQSRSEIKARNTEISELQKQVLQNAIAGQEAEKIRKELESEKKSARNLQEEVSDAKLERSLLEDRHKTQIKELESKLERGAQDAKATELDLRREVQVMESQLETYRTKAEEISSDGKGDVQAKLVRQIETLQSSYSVASENWRGIESSLMARIAIFEKDQAEAQKKEAELRRKLRELGSKYKDMEYQVETTKSQMQDLEESLAREVAKHKEASSMLAKTEADLKSAHADSRSTKELMEARLERLESEKREAVQESLSMRSRNLSPIIKTGFEPSISSSRRYPQSPGLPYNGGSGLPEKPHSRRASVQPGLTPTRKDSSLSLAQSQRSSIPQTPTINTEDDDDFFANTPATPPERTIHDMVSTSTAGAGPSVQLVERMSAAVRRLESEKEASRDELERLSAQRDEARNQVVGLMKELEDKKRSEERVANLETEIEELNNKLQTTLEMLGEKSELVEELRADISDMKEIYKATLESTVR